MDETSLHALLEQAVSSEPPAERPIGRIIVESRLAGQRLRWRRRIQSTVGSVAGIGVIAAASVLATGVTHPPSAASSYAGSPGTAYVLAGNGDVVPVNLATFRAGRPIKVGLYNNHGPIAARGDKTLYISGGDGAITPISPATGRVGRPIRVAGMHGDPDLLLGTPNGEFGYTISPFQSQRLRNDITPINLLTGTVLKKISLPPGLVPDPSTIAVSGNSKTVAVTGFPEGRCVGAKNSPNYTCYTTIDVSLINVASQRAQKPISLSTGTSIPENSCVAMSPDGARAFVAYYEAVPNTPDVIVPIDVATDRPLRTIKLPPQANGLCEMAVAPNGRTAYVLTGQYVTPVNLVTGKAEKPVKLTVPCWKAHTVVIGVGKSRIVEHVPAGCDSTTGLAIDPDGKMAYVLSTGGVVPVDLVTNRALRIDKVAAVFVTFTPNGKTALVGAGYTLQSIQAATGKVGKAIQLPLPNEKSLDEVTGIVVTPSIPVTLLFGAYG